MKQDTKYLRTCPLCRKKYDPLEDGDEQMCDYCRDKQEEPPIKGNSWDDND